MVAPLDDRNDLILASMTAACEVNDFRVLRNMLRHFFGPELKDMVMHSSNDEQYIIDDEVLKARVRRTLTLICAAYGSTECLELLHRKLPDAVDPNSANDEGMPALHLAIRNNNEETAAFLIRIGADRNGQDKQIRTPLHWAVVCQQLDMVSLLLTKKVSVNCQDIFGAIPLHYGVKMCCTKDVDYVTALDILQRLLVFKTNINNKDSRGKTPLMWAAASGAANVCRMLIAKGAAMDLTDHDGNAALHMASSGGFAAVVVVLAQFGRIDVNVPNGAGHTALQIALLKKHNDCVQTLLNLGARPTEQDNGRELPRATELPPVAPGVARTETLPEYDIEQSRDPTTVQSAAEHSRPESHRTAKGRSSFTNQASFMSSRYSGRAMIYKEQVADSKYEYERVLLHTKKFSESNNLDSHSPHKSGGVSSQNSSSISSMNMGESVRKKHFFPDAHLMLQRCYTELLYLPPPKSSNARPPWVDVGAQFSSVRRGRTEHQPNWLPYINPAKSTSQLSTESSGTKRRNANASTWDESSSSSKMQQVQADQLHGLDNISRRARGEAADDRGRERTNERVNLPSLFSAIRAKVQRSVRQHETKKAAARSLKESRMRNASPQAGYPVMRAVKLSASSVFLGVDGDKASRRPLEWRNGNGRREAQTRS